MYTATAAFGQSAPSERVCTDISGKIRLACPNEKTGTAPVMQSDPVAPDPTPSPSAAEPVSSGHMPQPTAASTDPGSPVPASATRATSSPVRYHSLEYSFARNLVFDQKDLWTSPLKVRVQDSRWLLPLAAGTAVVVLSDGDIERKLPTGTNLIKQSQTFSDYGAAGYAGLVAAGYLWSRATSNDHLRETAVLSGEAAINSLLVTEGVKYIAGRARPFENRAGDFQQGGSSFPSLHAAGAWSIASVIAREYPGPLTQLLAYGGAAAISAARVTGRQHFASDALVGSAIGWYAGRQIYNAHHDRENPDSIYGTFQRTAGDRGPRDPAYMGSPYVPLDTWVYPAIERLAAMGYIQTAFMGMRPWTRLETARLIEQAGTKIEADNIEQGGAKAIYDALAVEFAAESRSLAGNSNISASIDSLYTRLLGIAGPPMTDGFHFAQTIVDDYGRPYEEGFNAITGLSAHVVAGPFVAAIRGEFQHSPFAPSEPLAVRQLTSSLDRLPVSPATPFGQVDRFRAVEAYVGLNINDWQFAFGKQPLWWGAGATNAMILSNNAAPVTMLRVTQTGGTALPGLFRLLGPIRSEAFIGRLEGHEFVFMPPTYRVLAGSYGTLLDPQPYIHGEKLSLHPTANLDLAVSLTAVFGGQGVPVTMRNFYRTYSNTQRPQNNGDRKTGFEFRYRVPGLRNWLTLYNDSIAEDEPNPVAYPRRSAMAPGIYVSHVPHIEKLDFRVESAYTDLPNLRIRGMYYSDVRYTSYSNAGMLLGSWIGRQGRSIQSSSRYWFSPHNTLQLGHRYMHVSDGFIPGGGTLNDFNVSTDWALNSSLQVRGMTQLERWNFPVLASSTQQNVSVSVEVIFRPQWAVHK